jgi:RHS repeat-associated protein
VTVLGAGFVAGATTVTVAGAAASNVTVVSPTQLTFKAPAYSSMSGTSTAQSIQVGVAGGGSVTAAGFYYYPSTNPLVQALMGDVGITASPGGAVSGWADQSGAGQDMAQATLAEQPVLTPNYNQSGRTALGFAADALAKNGQMMQGAYKAFRSLPVTIYAVGDVIGSSPNSAAISTFYSTWPSPYGGGPALRFPYGEVTIYSNKAAWIGANPKETHVQAVVFNGASSTYWIDGVQVAGPLDVGTSGMAGLEIGAFSNSPATSVEFLKGHIAEVRVVSGVDSNADIATTSAIMGQRWVTPTPITPVAGPCELPGGGGLDCSNPACASDPVDRTVPTSIYAENRYLFEGPSAGICKGVPAQSGVAAGTIVPAHLAVLRGKVTDTRRAPLRGVTVTVSGHPEYGHVTTAADGTYALAVNGGDATVLHYEASGYLPVQRHMTTRWGRYASYPDVALTPTTAQATPISFGSAATSIVGATATDDDGTRTPFVVVPAGTHGTVVAPDGTKTPLDAMHVRIQEYTVGGTGPSAMPGDMPPTTSYTFCASFSVDEATAPGASIVFDNPLPTYLENYRQFPVGTPVPAGAYHPESDSWETSESGVVLAITGIQGGLAQVDTNGDGQPETEATLASLKFTNDELTALASRYQVGQQLWRVRLPHFSIWDFNWPLMLPPGAILPNPLAPIGNTDCSSSQPGSILHCESRSLGEVLPLAGTDAALVYDSARTAGRLADYDLDIPVTPSSMPVVPIGIELQVSVAGTTTTYDWGARFNGMAPAAPGIVQHYTWDGRDYAGRKLQGRQPVDLTLAYVYRGNYVQETEFGTYSAGTAVKQIGNGLVEVKGTFHGFIGSWDALPLGFGGWSLAQHHVYDVASNVLYLGNGGRRSSRSLGTVLSTIAGTGIAAFSGDGGPAIGAAINGPHGVAVTADGTVYFSDELNHRVRKIDPAGKVTTIAGTGAPGFGGDGGPATAAQLQDPMGLALDADGSLYIADSANARVRRVSPAGIIETYAGTGQHGVAGDGGPATAATFQQPHALAMGANGALYVTDNFGNMVRVITRDGIIRRIAGTGVAGYSGDGGLGVLAQINAPLGVAVGLDGSVYVAEQGNHVIRRVTPDGTISTFAGNHISTYSGDGGPATSASLSRPHSVTTGLDGTLYVTDEGNACVRQITPDGIISTIAGRGSKPASVNGPPLAAQFKTPRIVLAHQDGSLWIADYTDDRIRRFVPTQALGIAGQYVFPSDDGRELYTFDATGRHLSTVDAETGVTLLTFGYDAAGHVATMTDRIGNATQFSRDGGGCLVGVVGPKGVATLGSCDGGGYLANITNAVGATTSLFYYPGGLLQKLVDPVGNANTFTYDAEGLLATDAEPWGGSTTLAGTLSATSAHVTSTTAEGHTTTFDVTPLANGGDTRTLTTPTQEVVSATNTADGHTHLALPDGTVVDVTATPDSRFGMASPLATTTMKIPSATGPTIVHGRSVVLVDPTNPLSAKTVTETTSLNGATWTRTVDATAKTVTTTTPVGRSATVHYDAHGSIVEVDLPNRSPILIGYNTDGSLRTVTRADRVETFTYDANGFVAAVTDPLRRTRSVRSDGIGRIGATTGPDGATLAAAFNLDDSLQQVTVPGGAVHSFDYQNALPHAYTPPVAPAPTGPTTYGFTPDANLQTLARPDGQVLTASYDGSGRASTVTGAGVSLGYTYEAKTGRLVTMTNQNETLSVSYSGPFVSAYQWNGDVTGTVNFTLDSNFRVGQETPGFPGKPIDFTYDTDGRVTKASDDTIVHSATDSTLSSFSVGVVTEKGSLDPTYGELATLSAAAGSATPYSATFNRDALGRILSHTETIGGATTTYDFAYDSSDRLATVTVNGAVAAQFTYDANGNRHTASGGEQYDAQDRLIASQGVTYGYSAQGELISKTTSAGTTSYAYDGTGPLRKVTMPTGHVVDYVIDAMGRRVGKKVDGALQNSIVYHDLFRPVQVRELTPAGSQSTQYVYASSGMTPDYMWKGGVEYAIVRDWRGSVRLVVNAQTGAVAQQIDYDAWGQITNDTSPGFQAFGFAGGLYDADTGLVHFGAREYDPSLGRWISKDPSKFGGGANFYEYAGGDPINYIDPTGNAPRGCAGFSWEGPIAGAIEGAVFSAVMNIAKQALGKGCIDWGEVGNEALMGALSGATFGVLGELGSMNCFVAGTPVTEADGKHAIEDVKVGDLVWARNEDTGQVELRPVARTFVTPDSEVLEVTLESDDGMREPIRSTLEHPYWVDGKRWVPARELALGDTVWTNGDGRWRVAAVRTLAERATVYNFEVEGDHSYFVGESGAWVHNACGVQLHHVFPQEFANEFSEIFDGTGISPDDFTLPLPKGVHVEVHSLGWNEEWGDFLNGRGGLPTPRQTWDFMQRMVYKYGIERYGPFVPYGR